jgi:hypothetical protein
MSKHGRTKLVSPTTKSEIQDLETLEEINITEKTEEPVLTELDMEIECPRCNDIMELNAKFDALGLKLNKSASRICHVCFAPIKTH